MNSGYEKDSLFLVWEITSKCNYNCSYCSYYTNGVYNTDSISDEKLISISNLVMKKLESVPPHTRIELLGGEPSTHPKFVEIIKQMYENKNIDSISLYTNFSKIKIWEELEPYKDKLIINISIHLEYYKDSMLDRIKDYHHLHLMMIPDASLSNLYKRIIERFPNVYLDKLYEDMNNYYEYPEELEQLIAKQPKAIKTFKYNEKDIDFDNWEQYNKFKGWTCYTKTFYIDYLGNIRRDCTTETPKSLLLFNFNKPILPLKCEYDQCICGEPDTYKEIS